MACWPPLESCRGIMNVRGGPVTASYSSLRRNGLSGRWHMLVTAQAFQELFGTLMLTYQCQLLVGPQPPVLGRLHIDNMASDLCIPINMLNRTGVSPVLPEHVRDLLKIDGGTVDWTFGGHWGPVFDHQYKHLNWFFPAHRDIVKGFLTLLQSIYLVSVAGGAHPWGPCREEMVWLGQTCLLPGAHCLAASSVCDSPLCFPLLAIEFGHLTKAEVNGAKGNKANPLGYLRSSWSDGRDGKDSFQDKGQQVFSVSTKS